MADVKDAGLVEVQPEPAAVAAEVPPAIAAQTLGQYLRAWSVRIRSGDSGVLPVVLGLVIISVVFELISPRNAFFLPENLVNLFQQSAVFMVLAMAEIFVLLLGEIDLSLGYVGACGAVVTVQLVQGVTTNWPWWGAIIVGLLFCAVFGALQGTIISRLHVPSFVVTLAGFLIANGLMLILLLLGPFSGYITLVSSQPNANVLRNLMFGNIDPTISWIVLAIVVALLGGWFLYRDLNRRRSGLVVPPFSLVVIRILLMAGVGVAVVAICDVDRSHSLLIHVVGVPAVIPIVLGVLVVWTVLLQRTRFGRYVYAVGGNAEAARRAGVSLPRIRTLCFMLCSMTGGIGMILYASYLGGMSNNVNGGQLVLFAVAAAVIGGTSLFGGRGKAMHGVLGGLVIGGIYNGMGLIGLQVQAEFIVTGFVLIAAVSIDALSRRAASAGSAARV
ncbi:MAG: ABC transporter permease [Candidatus Dormibacteraeota bacterium]|nr:ABC transporter permease [Candidatus Dormibacteraeota bacterium]